ncbi:MAG: DUF2194 domain-containing protein [Lachnospiraceae bacterium]|nr:DUF2194 domain-containing protein [Lachnospiraceae bacterium]
MEFGKLRKNRFRRLYVLLACFLALGFLMFQVSWGMNYDGTPERLSYVDWEEPLQTREKTCLVLNDSTQPISVNGMEQFQQIFKDMKIGYDTVDLSQEIPEDFSGYKAVVVNVSVLDALQGSLTKLCDWVEGGGRVMFAQTLEVDTGFRMMRNRLGITECDNTNGLVEKISVSDQFMIGGSVFGVEDAYDSALVVSLSDDCRIYASTMAEYPIPLIWERNYGQGKFVVDNFGLCTKATRGFFAASYSLLEDVCIYPVIDGSMFYIDDFPSPVPAGDGRYIFAQYHMNIADFYANIWWPDMMELSQKYHIKFTGMIIESYENQVDGEFKSNTNTSRFSFFGDMLLDMGGELGYHGYNHQPLCLNNISYESEDYRTWPSLQDMKYSLMELTRFSESLFPQNSFTTYVPPSNILSREGRSMLPEEFPSIKNIASIYFSGENGYEQEYEVAPDGIIEVPRIISGCDLTDYMKLAAFSELNMHYVNSHFMHPDDLLDPDRGAAEGWETLKGKFTDYLDWLYTSAPNLRSLTGCEGAAAVQRFYQTSFTRTEDAEGIHLTLQNFHDEARFLVRINEGDIPEVKGGILEHITGNLYLLTATDAAVELYR